jgi:hypothetical protein
MIASQFLVMLHSYAVAEVMLCAVSRRHDREWHVRKNLEECSRALFEDIHCKGGKHSHLALPWLRFRPYNPEGKVLKFLHTTSQYTLSPIWP